MAFIEENGNIISFAEFDDVEDRDRRLFEVNEGLTDFYVEELLSRSTDRILTKLRATDWWFKGWTKRNPSESINDTADIPGLDPNKIVGRKQDFTDLCVYFALAEYIYPTVADFGNEEDSERNKMAYYTNKWQGLFQELVTAGDWYDWDDDGVVQNQEKDPGKINLKRVR
jgi:hypothetical protein